MISTRMLSIAAYLKKHTVTPFRETADGLDLKERSVRYDVDRINDLLKDKKLPLIEKRPKGVLVYPDGLPEDALTECREFYFSTEERMDLELMILMILKDDFKINWLARDFQVARSTVKNDIAALEKKLEPLGLTITYTDKFRITGPKPDRTSLLNSEFKKYLPLLMTPPEKPSNFEAALLNVIAKAYKGVSVRGIVDAVNEMLEDNRIVLADISYNWYISNVLILMWFIINGKIYPLSDTISVSSCQAGFDCFIEKLEALSGRKVSDQNAAILVRFLDFTSKFARYNSDIDLVEAEAVTFRLIDRMSDEMETSFSKDTLLVEGILSHMFPLLQRVRNGICLDDKMITVLSDEDLPVLRLVKEICRSIQPLNRIQSEDEYVYLVIYFLASIRRMKSIPPKKILLVCGHGYGTTTMLKEKLQNEYQIRIVRTLPVYRISTENLEGIDAVISTTKIPVELPVPAIVVNPLPTGEDYDAIEALGIKRKRIGSSLLSLEQKLDFLSSEDRQKVMDLIEKELGCQSVTHKTEGRSLRKLLRFDSIRLIETAPDWRTAVWQAGDILIRQGAVTGEYVDATIRGMEKLGFYAVTDGEFAMLHGRVSDAVHKTAMSLIVYKEPVSFGDKKAQVVFFLAPENTNDHIPAVIDLTRMIKNTTLLQDLIQAASVDEIYQDIIESEISIVK